MPASFGLGVPQRGERGPGRIRIERESRAPRAAVFFPFSRACRSACRHRACPCSRRRLAASRRCWPCRWRRSRRPLLSRAGGGLAVGRLAIARRTVPMAGARPRPVAGLGLGGARGCGAVLARLVAPAAGREPDFVELGFGGLVASARRRAAPRSAAAVIAAASSAGATASLRRGLCSLGRRRSRHGLGDVLQLDRVHRFHRRVGGCSAMLSAAAAFRPSVVRQRRLHRPVSGIGSTAGAATLGVRRTR